MESLGRADFKTVPGFAFRATFEVDIEGFTPVKVVVATTVYQLNIYYLRMRVQKNLTQWMSMKRG